MSRATLTAYDPAVNMLRGTVACFAAASPGPTPSPSTPTTPSSAGAPSELGRRLARNTQSVLALESHLGRVIDPAGGSWYVERLTDQLADAAWADFQDVEAAGGFRAAVEAGLLDERIAAVRAGATPTSTIAASRSPARASSPTSTSRPRSASSRRRRPTTAAWPGTAGPSGSRR